MQKMRVLIKIVFASLAIFSFCGILFRMGYFPAIFGNSPNYIQINEVIVNLSYSYMAALIFYILNDFIPNYTRKQKALRLIAPRLLNIYMKMDWILAIEKMEAGLDKENDEISLADCSFASKHDLSQTQVAIKSYIRINSHDWRSQPIDEWYERIFSEDHKAKDIYEEIRKIYSSSIAKDIDDDLLQLLYRIEADEYLSDIKILTEMVNSTTVQIIDIHHGQQKLFNFIQLLLELRKFDFDKHEHKIVRMTQDEENQYKDTLISIKPLIAASIKVKGKFKIYKGHQKII